MKLFDHTLEYSFIDSDEFSSINDYFNNSTKVVPKQLKQPMSNKEKSQAFELIEENSKLRYKNMRLKDEILVLKESLGSAYKSNMQK